MYLLFFVVVDLFVCLFKKNCVPKIGHAFVFVYRNFNSLNTNPLPIENVGGRSRIEMVKVEFSILIFELECRCTRIFQSDPALLQDRLRSDSYCLL